MLLISSPAWGLCNCIDAAAPIHEAASAAPAPTPAEIGAEEVGLAAWLYPGVMAIGAVAAAWVILRWRLLQLPRLPERGPAGMDPRELIAALILFVLFAGTYLAQPIGAGLMLVVTNPSDAERQALSQGAIAPETTQLGVMLRVGAYLAAGLVVFAWLMLRPRLMIGLPSGQPSLSADHISSTGVVAGHQRVALAALAGVIGLLLTWPLLHWVSSAGATVQALVTGQPPEVLAHDALRMLIDPSAGPWRYGSMALVILGAPIVEEAAYRGMLQPALVLLLRSRWWAIVVTSVVFVAPHAAVVSPHALPTLFVLSLGFGLVRERTGGVLAPMIMHAAFNGANVALAVGIGGM